MSQYFFIGNGRRVNFWKDIWCEDETLCNAFPSLFDLEAHKDAMVADVWDGKREERGWTLHFSKPFNDWEVERFLEYKLLLKEAKVAFVFFLLNAK